MSEPKIDPWDIVVVAAYFLLVLGAGILVSVDTYFLKLFLIIN